MRTDLDLSICISQSPKLLKPNCCVKLLTAPKLLYKVVMLWCTKMLYRSWRPVLKLLGILTPGEVNEH